MNPARRLLPLALFLPMLLIASTLIAVPQSAAAGSVRVTSTFGNAVVSRDGATTITVSGSGFQSVRGGFGGVYVLFGWVAGGNWQPSRGGSAGGTYLYVPDSESKNNQGHQRFVAFEGSSTAESANGGVIGQDGRWQVTMVVPGATFTAQDRAGAAKPVNCLAVQCGVITVGAHGVANANNETFTPVTFAGASQAQGPAAGRAAQSTSAPTAGASAAPSAAGQQPAAEQPRRAGAEGQPANGQAPAGPDQQAGVGVTSTTVIAGRALTFAGRGFQPGEQVVASLSGGQAAAGPMVAGNGGEIAGVLALPEGIRPGTHTLTLVGAASGQSPSVEIRVIADPVAAANLAEAGSQGPGWALIAVLIAAGLLFVLIVSSAITTLIRRRRDGRRSARPHRKRRKSPKSRRARSARVAATSQGGAGPHPAARAEAPPSPDSGRPSGTAPDESDNEITQVLNTSGVAQ